MTNQTKDSESLDLAALIADELVQQKPKGQSSTLVSAAVIVISMVAGLLGYAVDQDALAQILDLAIALAGAAGVVWGRVRAMHPITRKGAERMRTRVEQAVRTAQVRVGAGAPDQIQ